jgi:hypothetical protein
MNAQYEKANEMLIKMYNAEVEALKLACPDDKSGKHSDEYEAKHHEIYTRYNIIWAAIR